MSEDCRISKEIGDGTGLLINKWLGKHNFVRNFKLIVPKIGSEMFQTTFNDSIISQMECLATFKAVLEFVLSLDSSLQSLIKVLPLERDITHQNTFCISNGTITVKLDEEMYHRSGFKFKKSAFSVGNKRFVNQMFIHSFALDTFGNTNDPNYMRLLWFASNIDSTIYHLAITGESQETIDLIMKSSLNVSTQNFDISFNSLDHCGVPSFEINDDEDDQNEIFQWLKHEGEEHELVELDTSMDPYAVHFDEPLEIVDEIDIVVLIIKSTSIIPNLIPLKLINQLITSGSWFGFVSSGHKHVLKSFGSRGEHGFKNDGSNNVSAFSHDSKSILWKVMDRSDPN